MYLETMVPVGMTSDNVWLQFSSRSGACWIGGSRLVVSAAAAGHLGGAPIRSM